MRGSAGFAVQLGLGLLVIAAAQGRPLNDCDGYEGATGAGVWHRKPLQPVILLCM